MLSSYSSITYIYAYINIVTVAVRLENVPVPGKIFILFYNIIKYYYYSKYMRRRNGNDIIIMAGE